jgi:hypothetical protein
MSERDDRRGSLSGRAGRRLLETVSRVAARANLRPPPGAADLVILDAQQAAYVQLHRRFTERASQGVSGVDSALEALDAMWETIRLLRGVAPTVLATLSSAEEAVQDRRASFYTESTRLLEDAIRVVLATDLGALSIPPARLAVLVRVVLEGLVVELAQARDAADVARVDQTYLDMRALFEAFVGKGSSTPSTLVLDPIALPW